jgi:zinc/manganese transport system permease protein
MSIAIDLNEFVEILQLPFMQRALLGGLLMGTTGGILGSFTILRQLSFFSDTLGHSALLGISLGILMGLNPTWVLLPFSVIFALGVTYAIEKTELWTDALLNIVYSSSLAFAIILLNFLDRYKGGLNQLLFGDILGVRPSDLTFSVILLLACLFFLGLTFRTQMLITLNESLAKARGIWVYGHQLAFLVLLSLVVAISIKAIGVLLVSAFLVFPACAARAMGHTFGQYFFLSASLGGASAVLGIAISALLDLPSGPSIVAIQLAVFLVAIALPRLKLA